MPLYISPEYLNRVNSLYSPLKFVLTPHVSYLRYAVPLNVL